MIGEKVLWAGRECEIIDEDSDTGLIKIRKIDGTEEGSFEERSKRYAGIWLRNECVTNVYKENNNAK